MPQPWPGWACGSRSLIRRTSSGADGAPPYDTAWMLERSNSSKRGCSSNCQAMVGTPPTLVMRSRSMSSSAFSASKRRCSTSLLPSSIDGTRMAKHPVAWKNGTDTSGAFCGASGSGAGSASPRRRKARAWASMALKRLLITLRWLATAPFGVPVVPDV